jgi:hypothetical protein
MWRLGNGRRLAGNGLSVFYRCSCLRAISSRGADGTLPSLLSWIAAKQPLSFTSLALKPPPGPVSDQAPMSFSVLPTELVELIFQHAPPSDLATLARLSSDVSDAAVRRLYRQPDLITLHPATSPAEDTERKLRLLRTLADRPDVAQLVRSFFITLGADSGASPESYALLARALKNMTQLVSLTLRVDAAASWILAGPREASSPAAVSRRTHHDGGGDRGPVLYRRLRYLSCPFPLDAHVTEFLSRTSSLIELELDSIPSSLAEAYLNPRLPASAVPGLTHLVTSSRCAQVIVPGRPLQSVCIQTGDVDERVLRALSRSSAPAGIVVLGATTSMRTIPFLEAVSRHLSPAHVKMNTASAEFTAPPGQVSPSPRFQKNELIDVRASDLL